MHLACTLLNTYAKDRSHWWDLGEAAQGKQNRAIEGGGEYHQRSVVEGLQGWAWLVFNPKEIRGASSERGGHK